MTFTLKAQLWLSTLLNWGRYFEGISQNKTKEAIKKLVTVTPDKAYLKEKGKIKEITLDENKKR